jgi:valyl-tRNA synthetase
VDIDAERERLEKEIAKAKDELARVERQLGNEEFVSKAPGRVVVAEREKKEKLLALLGNLEAGLGNLP